MRFGIWPCSSSCEPEVLSSPHELGTGAIILELPAFSTSRQRSCSLEFGIEPSREPLWNLPGPWQVPVEPGEPTLELAGGEKGAWNLEPGTWNSLETFGMVSDNVVSEGYVTDVMEHLRM